LRYSQWKQNWRKICHKFEISEGAKLEYLEDVLVTWTGQVPTNNVTAIVQLITKQVKVLGQQKSVKFCIQKHVILL
jgi:hypothetical protein